MIESQTFTGVYDGHAIVPDQPLQLEPGQRIRAQIEPFEEEYPLTQILGLADDLGMDDLAERHTQYAHSPGKNCTDD